MELTRRAFLQQIGWGLTALGLSEAGVSLLTDRYQQVLAQPTRRKLALLVGINQYPEQVCDCTLTRGAALTGCLTDVELQRELLIYRFGFQPSDILILTDQAATRQGIEEAFLSHLTAQARPGDVVVFHFSGLGSRVQLDDSETSLQDSLVPVDGVLPTAETPVVNDLLKDTLGLLLRSLQTDQVTTILDTSYTSLGRVMQGNLRIRSRPSTPRGQLHEAELALQEQLFAQTGTSRTQIQAQWRSGQLPGVLLAATGANQVATEAQWNGFSAGLFTYALTQQLWWTTPAATLRLSLNQAIGTVKQYAGIEQQPYLQGKDIQNRTLSAYYLGAAPTPGADGVIRAIDDDGKVYIWSAGLPANVLENYSTSLFSLTSADVQAPTVDTLLQIRSREGLTLKARPYPLEAASPPQVGQLVQERIRLLPRNIGLTIALDASLERIERVDATSAFAAIPKVSSVIAGEQSADYLFGKAQANQTLTASLSPQTLLGTAVLQVEAASTNADGGEGGTSNPSSGKGSYGLFYLGRDAIPNTLIQEDEAVKTAVHRMAPQLRTLLAAKLLRLTANQGSSRLGVRATLEMIAPQERLIMQQETARSPWTAPDSKLTTLLVGNGAATVPVGSRIQYKLLNYSDRPVYFMLLGLDTNGNAIALHPAFTGGVPKVPDESLIPPGETFLIPEAATADWIVQTPVGIAETHIVFSRTPLTQAYHALEMEMRSKADAYRLMPIQNPLEIAQMILQDLSQGSSAMLPKMDVPADAYALDVSHWATLSFVYQVV